jgi:hypothetical protein
MELQSRGFVAGKSTTASGGRVVFWGNRSDGTCVKVLTKDGRYASIVDAPPASCGLNGRSSATANTSRKVNVSDLNGMSGISAFDVMTSRGFKNVDTGNSGNDLYSVYYNRSTRQCIQLITSNNRVVAVTDIQTHPNCR